MIVLSPILEFNENCAKNQFKIFQELWLLEKWNWHYVYLVFDCTIHYGPYSRVHTVWAILWWPYFMIHTACFVVNYDLINIKRLFVCFCGYVSILVSACITNHWQLLYHIMYMAHTDYSLFTENSYNVDFLNVLKFCYSWSSTLDYVLRTKVFILAPLVDSTRIIPLLTRPNDKVTDFASFPN